MIVLLLDASAVEKMLFRMADNAEAEQTALSTKYEHTNILRSIFLKGKGGGGGGGLREERTEREKEG